uniref:Uncharacterized protein n=1 Tax=Meloidogyne enterolobii TaxID=390850 RepID=A0A6V7W1P0_MELEN|nr:unnamed protein product [Meloidogyne enterolobii]
MKGNNSNIASSWPIIVNENALNEATQQQTPMSHSHPCLFLDGTKSTKDSGKRPDNLPQQTPKKTTEVPFKNNLYKSESDRTEKISTNQQLENENKFLNGIQQQNIDQNSTNLIQQKQQIEKLQRKCNRLEQLESSYRKIEKDYEEMMECEELSLITFYKLEHQLRLLDIENEQLKIENLTENDPKIDEFGQLKILEEKIENLENSLLKSQEKAKLAKERTTSIIHSQQQSTSNNSNIFGSILAASRLIGGEIQKVGKMKAQEFLPVGTEELFNKLNKELDNLLIGTPEKGQNENNEKTATTSSKFVDLLDIRRFNVFSTDFDQWSMSATTRDQNKEMSLPTNMSDENREQLLSLLGDEERGFDENNFCESKGEVRVLRQKILQKRKIKSQPRSLMEKRAAHNFKFDLTEEEKDKIKEPISEEREQKIMKILNKIINNEEEEESYGKQEEMENDQAEKDVELKDEEIEEKSTQIEINLINLNSKKEENKKYIYEEKVFDEENYGEEENSVFEWTIEDDNGEIGVIPSIELSEMLEEFSPPPLPQESSLKVSSTSSTLSSTKLTTTRTTTFSQSNNFYKIINKISNSKFWILLKIPYKINYFDYCQHFLIVCSKNRRPYFMMISSLKALQGKRCCSPQWNKLGIYADGVSINDDGTRLWRIWNGVGFSPNSQLDLIGPSSTFSKNSQWYQMTSRNEGCLLQVELTSKHAWYLTDRGVFVQMFLPASGMGYWYRTQDDDELDVFVQITASDEAVWVLNNFGMVAARVGLRRCPMGVDWAYLDNQPKKFVSISIYKRIGFGLDNQGVIWLINGVGLESPFGVDNWFNCSPLQVNSIPKMSPINEWRLSVGSIGIFVNVGTALIYLPEPFIERDADKEILLSKAREMPERTLSGGSATSWCELGK